MIRCYQIADGWGWYASCGNNKIYIFDSCPLRAIWRALRAEVEVK